MHQPGSSQDDKRQQRLQAIARPAARDPGPLVILVGKRTVAKVHSIGLVVKVDPTLGRVAVELEQHVSVIDTILATTFGRFAPVSISNP